MGYTHYWELEADDEDEAVALAVAWSKLSIDISRILELAATQIDIVFEHTSMGLALNGIGEGEHETFYFPANLIKGHFMFCKTARKPYDQLVTAILLRAKVHYGSMLRVSSDGTRGDWSPGRMLVDQFWPPVVGWNLEDEAPKEKLPYPNIPEDSNWYRATH